MSSLLGEESMATVSSDARILLSPPMIELAHEYASLRRISHDENISDPGFFSKAGAGCCIFSSDNQGTRYGLLNTCGSRKMLKLLSYNNGTLVQTRFIHMDRAEFRYVLQYGNQELIDSEQDWDMAQGENGASFVQFLNEPASDGWTTCLASNLNPRFYNAIEYDVFKNGARYGRGWVAIEPGGSRRIFPFGPDDHGFCFLTAARLDPL